MKWQQLIALPSALFKWAKLITNMRNDVSLIAIEWLIAMERQIIYTTGKQIEFKLANNAPS